jgi:hypothetical protein
MRNKKVHILYYSLVGFMVPGTNLLRIFLNISLNYFPRGIIRRIISDKEFPVHKRLSKNRVYRLGYELLMPICGCDDGEYRHLENRLSDTNNTNDSFSKFYTKIIEFFWDIFLYMDDNHISKYRIVVQCSHLSQCFLVDDIGFREIDIEVTIISTNFEDKRPRNISSTEENEVFFKNDDLFNISEW